MALMVSTIAAAIALIFLVIGLLFFPVKKFRKDLESPTYRVLYRLHVNAPKVATIAAFVHAFTLVVIDPMKLGSGWMLGVSLVLVLLLGAYISISNNAEPLHDQGDSEWRTIRLTKWFLTFIIVVYLLVHLGVIGVIYI